MQVIRQPELANDIREVAMHYAEISGRVLSAFWHELGAVLVSVNRHSSRPYFRASNQAPMGRHAKQPEPEIGYQRIKLSPIR
jgi:hypothetical protein